MAKALTPSYSLGWRDCERKEQRKDVRVSWRKPRCPLAPCYGLLVGCLTSQQHASVSQGRICSDTFTRRHTETEVADQTFHLTQSQYTDTGPTSPSTDPIAPGAWQGSHWSANFLSHWYDSTPEKSGRKPDSNPGPSALEADALTTRPTRWSPMTDLAGRRARREGKDLQGRNS